MIISSDAGIYYDNFRFENCSKLYYCTTISLFTKLACIQKEKYYILYTVSLLTQY